MNILEFFGLKEDPFRLTPDPAYFFPSAGHNEALQSLNYLVEQREGFGLVSGAPGTGKTTLISVFMESWKDKAEIAMILTPRLSPEEFLLAVLDDLNVKSEKTNKNDILKAFRDFLVDRSQAGRPVIIIVDEAQDLPDETLEELRLLSNLETDKNKLLQIILMGQPEINERLRQNNFRQLNQRITVRIRLYPLSTEEALDYINYRLIKAGKGFLRMDEKLRKPIHRHSAGVPRLINILSSRAIMIAYLEGSNVVSKKHVMYAVRHLRETQEMPQSRLSPYNSLIYMIPAALLLLVGYYAIGRWKG